jgi:hypothetical protein
MTDMIPSCTSFLGGNDLVTFPDVPGPGDTLNEIHLGDDFAVMPVLPNLGKSARYMHIKGTFTNLESRHLAALASIDTIQIVAPLETLPNFGELNSSTLDLPNTNFVCDVRMIWTNMSLSFGHMTFIKPLLCNAPTALAGLELADVTIEEILPQGECDISIMI